MYVSVLSSSSAYITIIIMIVMPYWNSNNDLTLKNVDEKRRTLMHEIKYI